MTLSRRLSLRNIFLMMSEAMRHWSGTVSEMKMYLLRSSYISSQVCFWSASISLTRQALIISMCLSSNLSSSFFLT